MKCKFLIILNSDRLELSIVTVNRGLLQKMSVKF